MSFFDDFKELGEILKQGKEELEEICTDGFKEMVIKDNNNYKTSYEKNDKAHNIIRKAENKYKDEKRRVKNYFKKTKRRLEKHFNYKKKIKDNVLEQWLNLMKDSRTIKLHEDNKLNLDLPNSNIDITLNKIKGFKGISIKSPIINLKNTEVIVVPSFYKKKKRVDEANKNLRKAKEFRSKVDYVIEELKKEKSKLKLLRNKINDEKIILEKFESKLKILVDSMNNFLHKQKLSRNEREKVKISAIIADAFADVLGTNFITESATITNDYKAVLAKLKKVEKSIEKGV